MKVSFETWVAIAAGVLVLAVPPFLFPYPPFHDLVAFIGLHSYPPKMSYGPAHYYGFQLTYILHHVISRICTDLGMGTQGQGRVFYLIHALGYFAVTAGLLIRFVRHERLRAIAIVAGALAFTDGMFAIGGPLAFSLAGVMIMLTVLVLSEARETDRAPSVAVLLVLAFLALLSHPFAAPFLIAVYAASFLVSPRHRIASLAAAACVLFYAFLIGRDSSENVTSAQLWSMFDPNLPHVWQNLSQSLIWDSHFIQALYGEPLPLVRTYVAVIAAIKLIGAILAVAAGRRLWREPRLRFLLLVELAFMALFVTGVDAPTGFVVPQWPWRIWSIANPVLYSFAVIAAVEVVPSLVPRMPTLPRPVTLAALAGLTVFLAAAQYQLFQKGRALEDAFLAVKNIALQSGARDAVVSWAGADNIHPFYLRSAPFLLFSDPQMLERKLLFVTDWHAQPRHNTHIPEVDFPSTRQRLVLEFYPSNGTILGRIRAQQLHFPVKIRFGDRIPRGGAGEPILTTGKTGDANFLFVLATIPGTVTFYLDAWGVPWIASTPVAVDPNREYALDIALGSEGIKLQLDGATIWERSATVRSLDNPQYGKNSVGGTTALPSSSGTVTPLNDHR